MRERAPLQLSFVGIEVRVLRPVRVCLDAVALRLGVERQSAKSVAKKRESVSTQTACEKAPKPPKRRPSCDRPGRLGVFGAVAGRASNRIKLTEQARVTKHLATEVEKLSKQPRAPRIVLLEVAASGRVEPAGQVRVSTRRFRQHASRGCARTRAPGVTSHHITFLAARHKARGVVHRRNGPPQSRRRGAFQRHRCCATRACNAARHKITSCNSQAQCKAARRTAAVPRVRRRLLYCCFAALIQVSAAATRQKCSSRERRGPRCSARAAGRGGGRRAGGKGSYKGGRKAMRRRAPTCRRTRHVRARRLILEDGSVFEGNPGAEPPAGGTFASRLPDRHGLYAEALTDPSYAASRSR